MRIMRKLTGKLVCVMWAALCLFVARAYSQETQEETLGGPDSHETGQGRTSGNFSMTSAGRRFGTWSGRESRKA
jgi:hypothetical protein